MAGQANIVSFDEARTGSRNARPSAAPSKKATKRPSIKTAAPKAKPSAKSTVKPSVKPAKPSVKTSARSSSKASVQPSRKASVKLSSKMAAKSSPQVASKPSKSGQLFSSRTAASNPAPKASRNITTAKRASKKQQTSSPAPERNGRPVDDEAMDAQEAKRSKLAKMKRDQAKAKAGKAFSKQFGGTSSSESTEGGTRAALYKGEMGRKHKQATRMQGNPAQGMSASKKRGSVSFNPRSPKFIASIMVAACLVLSCAFLYPTAKQFYITTREHDQLAAEYDALQQRNASIQSEVDTLSTDAGIEDRARKEFGWVKGGENAVNVYGLETYESDSTYNKAVLPGSVAAPQTWYSPMLDTLFGL